MSIVNVFRDIVRETSEQVISKLQLVDPSIAKVHYQHGHYPEINETLMQIERAGFRYDKYPMVALLEDISSESVKMGMTKYKIRVLVCHSSEYDSKSKDRHEKVINPILMPIVDELISQVDMSKYNVGYGISPKVAIRPHWGVRGANDIPMKNMFDDIVDVVDIAFDFLYYDNCK